MKRSILRAALALVLAAQAGLVLAADKAAPPAGKKLTVAILDFTASDPTNPKLGSEISAALSAMLSGEAGMQLVERESLVQTLREHELNMTGLVSENDAVKVGKLVGAKIMVTGRAFRLGKETFLTAKLIGTETSLVEGVMVKDGAEADMGELAVKLAEKVGEKIRKSGANLVSSDTETDPLPALKKKLADRKKPVVAVVVREQHHGAPVTMVVRPIDPAVETEIKKMLIDAGFTVQDVAQNELAGFAHEWTADKVDSWPRGLAKVDVLVAGEAFSEYAARIGNIVSCSARAEINLIGRSDGKIALADRTTTRAADLSETIAGKKALQAAGRTVGIHVLEHFAETLPAKK